MNEGTTETVDALVIGGGIAGIQAALDLADQDFKVLLVDKEPSIGGRMIGLSKVFPTLDCGSCITTPKMSAAAHHRNIKICTYTEVEAIEPGKDVHRVRLKKKPRYVDENLCIGCGQCEYACPMAYPDPFEGGLGAIRAIAVPFMNAIPQLAVLDPENCIACGACARVCPTDAVRYDQEPEYVTFRAKAVIIATGFRLNDLTTKPQYNAALSKNIISPLTMERLLAPHGPYGRVLRPSDGKIPQNIAYVQCAGSRDESIGVPYCSRVCCMYAIKQAMLLSGALPMADITIYYMDIRAFGKGYDQFYQNAKAMGINFVRGKVARITPADGGELTLRLEAMEDGGTVRENRHDLVVLSQGIVPLWNASAYSPIRVTRDGFVSVPDPTEPTRTSVEGIFTAGMASSPKDIVDAIIEAGAAAMSAGRYIAGKSTSASPRGESQAGNPHDKIPSFESGANHERA
jgi:heterodisulfide reductase subunit A